MKKGLLLSMLFISFIINAQKSSVPKALKAFELSFQQKDYNAIKTLLAPEFTVGVGDSSSNEFYLTGIFKAFPVLDSMQIGKSTAMKKETRVAVHFFFKGKEKRPAEIVFNKENKILYVTFFDALYKVDRNAEVKKLASIPFEMLENGIAIKIKLNKSDREFVMLFDTGADGMALNPDSAHKAGVVVTNNKSAAVVGGSQQVQYSADNTIYIGNQIIKNQGLVIFPKSGAFDGLFGANLLRNYITKVNFDTKTIDLYNFGNFVYEGKVKPLVFDYKTGLPVVKMNLTFSDNKKAEGNFAIDTGASYDLIAYGPFNHKHNLQASLKTEYTSTNFSLGHQTQIVCGAIPNVGINGNNFPNVTIALQEYQEENKNWASADGSLGIDLIKRFNFTIDLLHKTVYLEPNKSFAKLSSFYVSGLDLDFDEKNNLIVTRVLDTKKDELKNVKTGAKVIQINDFEAKDLLNPANIKKVKENTAGNDLIIEQAGQSMRISL
ncbi:retropepsin-like aspartic protease [Flavobacterium sp. A45]|uniref:retropepsin-like aspartic protease n=1 Tax=Flavobacterium sp. A45 TaxID=1945862 RepID=UPI000985C808|nr:retropepsin-like aspartic protease [Flavobacterium sp. A45]OOG69826.1 hypothetical protein B0E44_11755 [Flavobacterium sp. A45]